MFRGFVNVVLYGLSNGDIECVFCLYKANKRFQCKIVFIGDPNCCQWVSSLYDFYTSLPL